MASFHIPESARFFQSVETSGRMIASSFTSHLCSFYQQHLDSAYFQRFHESLEFTVPSSQIPQPQSIDTWAMWWFERTWPPQGSGTLWRYGLVEVDVALLEEVRDYEVSFAQAHSM